MSQQTSTTFALNPADNSRLAALCGELNSHIKQIEGHLNVKIVSKGNLFSIDGKQNKARDARSVLEKLYSKINHGAQGLVLCSATEVFVESRRVKLPSEIHVMRAGVGRVGDAVAHMLGHLCTGATEIEVWSHFHQRLIANDGEYVSTRLVQAGERTFPYFQEAGPHQLSHGDLFCIDTDAIGYGGYGVDFSRTYTVGSVPTTDQRSLHARALDQLEHNADLLGPGVSFAEFADRAWVVPARHAPWGYYCLAHGLGLCGEYPYVPLARRGVRYDFDGEFEAGMVICIESYIGDETLRQGVKLEDQYLITATGTERLTTAPFDPSLCSARSPE